jgi:anti-sigma factor RsiW
VSGTRYPDDAVERELIAFALGQLDPIETERLERRLASDPHLRSRLAELGATVLTLSQLPGEAWEAEEPPPPPALDPNASQSAPAVVAAPALRRRRIRRRGGLPLLRPLTTVAAAAALLAVGVLVGVLARSSSSSASAHIIASARLAPIDNVDPSARAVFRLASDETARFEVSGLAPTDGRHVYELWLMDSTSDLISVATFRVNAAGRAQLTLTLPAAPSHFRYLDVSLQPLDGTALHSKTSVLRGPTPA